MPAVIVNQGVPFLNNLEGTNAYIEVGSTRHDAAITDTNMATPSGSRLRLAQATVRRDPTDARYVNISGVYRLPTGPGATGYTVAEVGVFAADGTLVMLIGDADRDITSGAPGDDLLMNVRRLLDNTPAGSLTFGDPTYRLWPATDSMEGRVAGAGTSDVDGTATGDPWLAWKRSQIRSVAQAAVTAPDVEDATTTRKGIVEYGSVTERNQGTRTDRVPSLADVTAMANRIINERAAAVQAITDGANLIWDWDNAFNFTVTIAGNRTLQVPTNGLDYTVYQLLITQDSTGSRTVTLHASIDRGGRDQPELSTQGGTTDLLIFEKWGNTVRYLGVVLDV